MTKTPELQQLSEAPELAVQVVDDQDDGTVEQAGEDPVVQLDDGQAGDEPAKEEPAVRLDVAPLDETQSPREDRILRAVRLELERLRFEKEAKRRFRRARKSSTLLTLPCFPEHPRGSRRTAGLQPVVTHAASVPLVGYVSPISVVYAAAPVNEYATHALIICRQEL